jgi:thiamine biosynthesis lipoprotein
VTPATSLRTWVGTFRAMNTQVEVQLVAEPGDARADLIAVEAVFTMYERTLSRFLAASALSRVNEAAGRWVQAPELLLEAVAEAVAWSRRLPGLFDPTVLDAVVAAGYDRSFEQLPAERPGRPSAARVRGTDGIECDVAGGRMRLPAGTRLDLGGIGKGLAVDTALAMLGSRWVGAMINAGGDIAVRGASAAGPWCVAVADPRAPDGDLATVTLGAEALATSSTMRRRWRIDGEVHHHLIDPGTGRPSASPIAQCTVIAPTCAAADVLAKAILLAGPAEGERVLAAGGGTAALAVTGDGTAIALGDWEAHLA